MDIFYWVASLCLQNPSHLLSGIYFKHLVQLHKVQSVDFQFDIPFFMYLWGGFFCKMQRATYRQREIQGTGNEDKVRNIGGGMQCIYSGQSESVLSLSFALIKNNSFCLLAIKVISHTFRRCLPLFSLQGNCSQWLDR